MVAIDGREFLTWEELEEYEIEDEENAYTPNYISSPERCGDVVGLANIDTKGEHYTWMFAEELRAEGAVPAKIVPFPSGPIDYPSDAQLA